MSKVLIAYDLRMENTKLTAMVIGKGEREADSDTEVRRRDTSRDE
jgi:hypothetical protein